MARDAEKDLGRQDPMEEEHRSDGSKTAVGITTLVVITGLIIIIGGIIAIMM